MELHLREGTICTHSRECGILRFDLVTWSPAMLLQHRFYTVGDYEFICFFHKKKYNTFWVPILFAKSQDLETQEQVAKKEKK